jgi:uncharacterized protein (DUF1330 family)
MPAYLIAHATVTDPDAYETYKRLAQAAIARYGGRYVVRGGTTTILEGNWKPSRLVVVEFPSLAAAEAFYDSPEYREARQARTGAAEMDLVAVEGV